MKTRNIFGRVALMALVIFSSCSKEDVKTTNDVVILEVPGLQQLDGEENQSQSRTSFELEGAAPKVKWIKGDEIYIGYINPKSGAGKELTTFIENGNLIKFTCTSVDDNTNIATFEGASIPDNANIAVYTMIPGSVYNHYKSNDGATYGVKCRANAVSIKADNSHLAENDLLVSVFNSTDNKLDFKRLFALAKFDFTLPESVTETSGTFSCDRFKLMVRGAISVESPDDPISVDNSESFENIVVPVNGNKISFYSLIPKVTIKNETNTNNENYGKGTKITYTIKIGENTYTAEKDYGRVEITPTSALEFKATLTKE